MVAIDCTEKAPCGSGYTRLRERIELQPLCLACQ